MMCKEIDKSITRKIIYKSDKILSTIMNRDIQRAPTHKNELKQKETISKLRKGYGDLIYLAI